MFNRGHLVNRLSGSMAGKSRRSRGGDKCGMKSGRGGAPAGQRKNLVATQGGRRGEEGGGVRRGEGEGAGRGEGWRLAMMDALLSFRAP